MKVSRIEGCTVEDPALYSYRRDRTTGRFAGLASGPADGVLLIAPFDVPDGEDDRFLAAWETVREGFSARRGYLGAQMLRSPDARFVAVVHWSSPLMYARTVREEGDAIAALPFPGRAALYVRERSAPR